MSAKEFVAVTWSPRQLIDEDSLDQMNNNLTYLRDNTVDGLYQHMGGGSTTKGIKMAAGRAIVTPRKSDDAKIVVRFNKLFTTDSAPIVTTSISSTHQTNIFCTISGIGKVHPNHQGFEARINIATTNKRVDRIVRKIYVNWIAVGY